MQSRMDDFRAFVNKYPKLRDEVRSGNRTWQSIYEEWVLYGESSEFEKYRDGNAQKKEKSIINSESSNLNMDNVRNVLNYIKRINPDDLNKTLNTVQKVIQIAQTVGGSKAGSISPIAGSAYNDWWD